MMRWSYVDVIVITFSAPATPAIPGGRPIAPGGHDRPLALHQPRDRGDRPDPARVGEREVGALEVVRGELVLARALDQVAEGGEEVGEREAPGVADHRHHQRPPTVLALDVDGDPEVDRAGVDHVRLAVDLLEGAGHDRHLLGRGARDRVGDQVGEGDALALGLELLAALVERRDGDGAERRRGRDRARLVHVAGEHRAGALERGGLGGGGRRPVRARRCPRRRARRPSRSGRRGRCPGSPRGRSRAPRRPGGPRAWP